MRRKGLSPAATRTFRQNLLAWFDLHKRDLPWRRTRAPYAIWVSEIMLQQTRVAAVLDHYARWMLKFPTVETLAAAREEEVLTAWSGLGYYRRARFLHRGARAVVAEHNGHLPQTAAELRTLPGIGAYTSAAIASIAFGEAAAVVDGNVERVILRQTGAGEAGAARNPPPSAPSSATANGADQPTLTAAEIQALASRLIDPDRPGDFNQAMMELGATTCLPRNPLCLQCPVQASCKTRGEHPTAERKPSTSVSIEYAFLHRKRQGTTQILLEQRPASASVMPGMWELPRVPPNSPTAAVAMPRLSLRHAIMQTNYRVAVLELPSASVASIQSEKKQSWIKLPDLISLPLTGLARKVLLRLELLNGSHQNPARTTGILLPPK